MENITHSQKIMIVEEEQNIALSIATKLQTNHFGVKIFTDPFMAIEEFQKHRHEYSLVISDMKMTRMSTFEFMRTIKSTNPAVKILLITTFEIKPAEFNKVIPSLKVEGLIAKQLLSNEIIPSVNKILGFSTSV